jgi:hypothetical protein
MKTLEEKLKETGTLLMTQDNRCTADPAFCVQVMDRIGPIMSGYSDNVCFHDHEECETYYHDTPDPEKWEEFIKLDDKDELPDNITKGGYTEKWFTIQVCFTEEGCKRYLELDGHNLRHYHGTRIYAESFRRNPEMLEIREFLISMAKKEEVEEVGHE